MVCVHIQDQDNHFAVLRLTKIELHRIRPNILTMLRHSYEEFLLKNAGDYRKSVSSFRYTIGDNTQYINIMIFNMHTRETWIGGKTDPAFFRAGIRRRVRR